MNKMHFRNIFILFFLISSGLSLHAQKIDPTLIDKISKTVVEVVLKKPVEGRISYEKELPLENIDFKTRNDEYYPVGTAFILEGGRLLSAAHVFSPESASPVKAFGIRDALGRVYPVTTVHKYSDHRDFILFEAEGFESAEFLEVNREYRLNDAVYAVGNALGDGIVIRDGLLTSVTPESEAGAWDWLRFSAAASPGNSGGPLLDGEGRVVGLIAMKSINENLNFALPISEVLAAPVNLAVSHRRLRYSIAVFNNYVKTALFETEIALPLDFGQFHIELMSRFHDWTSALVKEIAAEWDGRTFPAGKGAQEIIHSIYSMPFPGMIAQKQDGGWSIFKPQSIEESDIGEGGMIGYGKLASFTMGLMKKPDSVPLQQLYTNSTLFMDLVLKGLPFYREIAGENIRITSMGKAESVESHRDRFGRRWIVSEWSLDYADTAILVYALPVPEGLAFMIRAASTETIQNGFRHDFKFMSDYLYLSYDGSFSAWKEFLGLPDMLPGAFLGSSLDWTESRLEFKDSRLALAGEPRGMSWSGESRLEVQMSFRAEPYGVEWAPRGYLFSEGGGGFNRFELKNILDPHPHSPEQFKEWWNRIDSQIYPYDGRLIEKEGATQQFRVAHDSRNNSFYLINLTSMLPFEKEDSISLMKSLIKMVDENPELSIRDLPGNLVQGSQPVTPSTAEETPAEEETVERPEEKGAESSAGALAEESSEEVGSPDEESSPENEGASGPVKSSSPSEQQASEMPVEADSPSVPEMASDPESDTELSVPAESESSQTADTLEDRSEVTAGSAEQLQEAQKAAETVDTPAESGDEASLSDEDDSPETVVIDSAKEPRSDYDEEYNVYFDEEAPQSEADEILEELGIEPDADEQLRPWSDF